MWIFDDEAARLIRPGAWTFGSLSTRKSLGCSSEQLAALLIGRVEVVGFTAQAPSSNVSAPGCLIENRMFDWLETKLRSRS